MKRVLNYLLNRIGYYHCDMPAGATVTEKEILEMFQAYGSNEQFGRFLRDLCANDIKLNWQASNDRDRDHIHGASQRTMYFISLIKKSNDKRKRD